MSEENYFASVDWSTVEPQGAGRETFSVDGWHKCIIADSKGAPNSKNTGMLFTAYLKCMEGPDNGKTIDENINVFHQNPQAQEIGQRQFSAYCHALGEFKPIDNHASNFRNKPLMVRTETVDEEFQNSKGETVKTKRTYVRELARVGDPKTNTGNASSGQTATAAPPPQNPAPAPAQATTAPPSNEAPAAGWGPPPPGAGEAPAQAAQGGWGQAAAPANGNAGAARQAPWGAS